jgi:hypothetical protein
MTEVRQTTAGGGQPGAFGAVDASTDDVDYPAVNTAAVVTYAAVPGQRHYITGVNWSYYGGIPTGGNLTITFAGAVVFEEDINEEGPGFVTFPLPKRSPADNQALVITLTAGGAAVFGGISILNRWSQ